MPSHRKHTPITSQAQQGMFGAELQRRREGKKGKMSGITTQELVSHLHESAGKDLPQYAPRCSGGPVSPSLTPRQKKSTKGSPEFTQAEISQGYRRLKNG